MKLSHLVETLGGVLSMLFSWHVYASDRVIGRHGVTAMTKETHPWLFWIEVAAFGGVGMIVFAYGVAGIVGLERLRDRLDAAAGRVAALKLQSAILAIAMASFFFGLAWLVFTELIGK